MKKVIIVGGGIVGASCAYELIQKNIDVVIVDAHKKGRATSAAAGVICPWLTQRRNKSWYELAKQGALYYDSLIKKLTDDGKENTGYKKVGMIRLEKNIDMLDRFLKIGLERKKETPEIGLMEVLHPDQIKENIPYLTEDYYGLYIENAARVDGSLLRDSLIQASIKRGASYKKGHASLIRKNNQFIGVQVDTETLYADDIIVVNGAWMKNIFEEVDIQINVGAQKGQIIDLYYPYKPNDTPIVKPPNNQYILTMEDGRVVVGATQENTNNLQPTSTAYGVHYILQEALTYAPHLQNAEINEIRVGFRPTTYNHAPMFGPIPGYKNIYIGTGLGASGLNTGPFMGKQLAKLVMNEKLNVNVNNYSVSSIINK